MDPKRLKLNNFGSFEELDLSLDFKSALLLGQNGAGKSSILNALAWVLYGKSKHKQANNVIKRGSELAEAELEFDHNGNSYKIIRRRSSKSASQNSVEFYEIKDGEEVRVRTDTNSQCDAKIREALGSSYEVFINTSYFQQGQIAEFLTGAGTKRQKLVSSILNLDRWDKYGEVASSKQKKLDRELDMIEYKLSALSSVEDDLVKIESRLADTRKRLEETREKGKQVDSKVKVLSEKASRLKEAHEKLNEVESLNNKKNALISRLAEIEAGITSKEEIVKVAAQEKKKNADALKDIRETMASISETLGMKDRRAETEEKEKKLYRITAAAEQKESQIKHLESSDECDTCGNVYKDAARKKEEVARISKELSELQKRIKKGQVVISKLREHNDKVRRAELEIEKLSSRKKNIENNIKMYDIRATGANNELKLLKERLDISKKEISQISSSLEELSKIKDVGDFDDIKAELDTNKRALKELRAVNEDLMYKTGALSEKKAALLDGIKEKEVLVEEKAQIAEEITTYAALTKNFGRNGIQAVIMDNVMEELSIETNNLLEKFTSSPTYVEFITQKKDSKNSWKETLDIAIRTSTGLCDFESLSGGEAFRVAFSIRLALSKIQARRFGGGEAQLLMLDEVSTSLDPEGLSMFTSIIKELEKSLKVMVITHDDSLKEEFENTILVTKENGDSSASM